MNRAEVEQLLNALCDDTAAAVAAYVDSSGESSDQMPEFVMSCAAALGLAARGTSAILEANAQTLRERISGDVVAAVEAVTERLGGGRIDLVVLSAGDDPKKRKPIGFIEFKRWKYDQSDANRVADLLSGIPGAEFGACVFLRNTLAEHPWLEGMRESLRPSGILIVRDTSGRTRAGEPCCIACFAQLRSA